MTSALEVSGLTLQSGRTVVLDRVDLTVPLGTDRGDCGPRERWEVCAAQCPRAARLVQPHGDVIVLGLRVREHIHAVRSRPRGSSVLAFSNLI